MAKATRKTDDISNSLPRAPVPDPRNVDLDLWLWVSIFPALTFNMLVNVRSLSHVRLFATPWTIAYQAPPSMGFSRQEYWSGWPFPSPGDLPNPEIEPGSPALEADALPFEPPRKSDMSVGSFKPETSVCWLLSFDFHRRIFIAFPTTRD